MPVKYVELGLLYAPPGRALFQELFQEAKGRGIECGQFHPKIQCLVQMGDEFAVVENRANSAGL